MVLGQLTGHLYLWSFTMQSSNVSIDHNAAGLERLRLSKQVCAKRNRVRGFEIGQFWALKHPEHDQLEQVAEFDDTTDDIGPMELTIAINGDGQPSWSDVGECMEYLFGTDRPSKDLIAGFIEGAAAIFRQVP
jgi:hypothetical protein